MKKIGLLGASGSIGTQSIDVLRNYKDKFELVAFSVGKNIEYANEILEEFKTVQLVCVQNKSDVDKIKFDNVVYGEEGLVKIATHNEINVLITAVVGSVGLMPTIESIKAGKDIALANKETLVMAGHLIMPLIKEIGVNLLPVDSEHSAIFQSLNGENKKEVNKLIITASGGSFRDKSLEELEHVTKEEALNHPNWSMGSKITIDSATMVNKGLEVIEAHWLFDIDYDDIEVLIHKQSIIHSMVEYDDYSVIAQLGTPDMRLPIQYALTYPNRLEISNSQRLNLAEIKNLEFKDVDYNRYIGIKLAYIAGKKGHSFPTVYNSVNEKAVELFLDNKISFIEITNIIQKYMDEHKIILNPTLEQIIKLDVELKQKVQKEYECQ